MSKLRVADPCVASWDEMTPSSLGRRCDRCAKDVHDLRFVTEARARAIVLLFGGEKPPCIRVRVDEHGDAVFRPERATSTRRPREPVIVAAALASLSAACGGAAPAETVATPAVCAPVARIHEEAPIRARVSADAASPRSAEPAPDSDGDGVVDALDGCPDDAAGAAGVDGCPPVRRVVVVQNGGASALEQVRFAMNASALTPDAVRILDQIGKILAEHPEIVRVNVIGHAAPDEMNADRIAAKRADLAVKYLVGHGVDASRLAASGAGSARPVADNATAEGRAHNRRLELVIQAP